MPEIVIDRRKLRVTVIGAGRERVMPCALGMKGFRTPKGRWILGSRSREPDWRAPVWAAAFGMVPGRVYKFGKLGNPYRAGLINLIGIDRRTITQTGYAIHGTSNPDSIPGYGSHGCIRLHDADLLWIYAHCPSNTLVTIV